MRRKLGLLATLSATVALAGAGSVTSLTPRQIVWGPHKPPVGLPGAEIAVLQGEPDQPGSVFTFRLKLGDGYRIPPHWHGMDEAMTIIQGTAMMGLGERYSVAVAHPMPPGSFCFLKKGTRHFLWCEGETVIELHGIGPFTVYPVDPKDIPGPPKTR